MQIEPRSPALQVDSLPPEPPGKPYSWGNSSNSNDTIRQKRYYKQHWWWPIAIWIKLFSWSFLILPCKVNSLLVLGGDFFSTWGVFSLISIVVVMALQVPCYLVTTMCCALILTCVWICETPWTVAHQAPLSLGLPSKNTEVSCHFLLQGVFQPRDWTSVPSTSCIGRQILCHWTTWETMLPAHNKVFLSISGCIILGLY